MLQYLLGKFVRMSAVLTGAMFIMFMLMHAIPGNPWNNYSSAQRLMLGLSMDVPQQEALARRFGLDLPLWRQFTRYVIGDVDDSGTFFCGAICGNLGPSILRRGRSVQQVLFEPPPGGPFWKSQFGYSLRLVLLGSLLTVAFGIPLGILSALRPRSRFARSISFLLALLTAIPNFVFGLLAVIVVAVWLKLVSVIPNWDNPAHWLIPGVVLAAMPLASLARVTRASLMNIFNEDYVRTARAKGLTEWRVMLVHVLRSSLAPIITFLGPSLMEMFTGLVIVENMFGFPGIGREYWDGVLQLDYPMIMGVTVFFATGMTLTNFLVESLSALLDPRIRSARQAGSG